MGHSEPLGNRGKTSRGEEAEEEGVCGRRRRCSLFFLLAFFDELMANRGADGTT